MVIPNDWSLLLSVHIYTNKNNPKMYSRRHRRPPAHRTRHHRHNKTSTSHDSDEKHSSTFHGLHHWHKHAFEHLGWMVLAKSHGCMEKVHAYQSSLQHLKHALECRIRTIHDVDRKCDLKTLHCDICCLIDHAHKDF